MNDKLTDAELTRLFELNTSHSQKVAELGIISWKKIELSKLENEVIGYATDILDELNVHINELSEKYPHINITKIITDKHNE